MSKKKNKDTEDTKNVGLETVLSPTLKDINSVPSKEGKKKDESHHHHNRRASRSSRSSVSSRSSKYGSNIGKRKKYPEASISSISSNEFLISPTEDDTPFVPYQSQAHAILGAMTKSKKIHDGRASPKASSSSSTAASNVSGFYSAAPGTDTRDQKDGKINKDQADDALKVQSLTPSGHALTTPSGHALTSPSGHALTTPSGHALTSPSGHALTTPSGHALTTPSGHALTTPSGHALTTPSGHALTTPSGHALTTPSGHVLTTPSGHALTTPSGHALSTPSGHALTTPSGHALTTPSGHALTSKHETELDEEGHYPDLERTAGASDSAPGSSKATTNKNVDVMGHPTGRICLPPSFQPKGTKDTVGDYLMKHKIGELFDVFLMALLKDKPDKPADYLHEMACNMIRQKSLVEYVEDPSTPCACEQIGVLTD